MKVLLGHNFYRSSAPSGEDAVYRNEKRMLEEYGVEVVSYEVFNDHIDTTSLSLQAKLAWDTAWSRKSYEAINQLIKRAKPDVAHFHNTFPQISPSAYAACRDNEISVVQTLHNFRFICPGGLLLRDGHPCEDCVGTNLLPALRHRCYRGSLPATAALTWMLMRNRLRGTYHTLVDRYIALTKFAADRLIAGGLPSERMSIKPNFTPDVSEPGLGDGDYAVFVGRLSEEKGLRTLVAAWQSLPDVPLKIIGNGPLRDELAEYASRKNLSIEFLGSCDRATVLRIVGRAKFQVIPSEWYEGFPMVVLEAYACGTPVVSSRIGSLQEIVREGETGVTFKAGDSADLILTVRRLLSVPADLPRLRHGARSEYVTRYTSTRNFAHLMEIYRQTLDDSPNIRSKEPAVPKI